MCIDLMMYEDLHRGVYLRYTSKNSNNDNDNNNDL